ncbi:PREDICTED: uncharacterized protein LOC109482447 [Branchiostoma belcheri]|uniref:Uncharacterized protein LOC109482447 n=1 Tax=Branchiostoma belcheri TaxID=7741 RepID=A0A6P4ZHS2_BRABE|nr:PREDICTED: uncharacterized protein LOC109482447 [Branchiostoma belcheri]
MGGIMTIILVAGSILALLTLIVIIIILCCCRLKEHCDACCPSEEDDKNFPHIYRTHHGLNDRTSSTTNARQGRICRSGSLYVSAV